MPIRFVIGRAGTGKTRRCFDAIANACRTSPLVGPPIYWIVPKQATFTAERELTCCAGLPAVSRARVVGFEQLARDLLDECGGSALPLITPIGRQMVIGHLLREQRDSLRYFKSVAHHPGFAAELDGTFGEFERVGKSPSDVAEFVASLDVENQSADASTQSLAAKLHDLHLLFNAYRNFLGQEHLDPHHRQAKVLDCIGGSKRIRGATVFIDGFFDFTDNERKLVAALSLHAADVEVTLRCHPNRPVFTNAHLLPDEMSTFHLIEENYRKLWFAVNEIGAQIDPTVVLRTVHRFHPHALRHLEASLATDVAKPTHNAEGLSFIEAPDRRAEVDAVARHIQSLVGEGFRYREIVVLVRQLDDYADLIDAGFREHRLPWFVDRRRSASHHPLLRFTRALPAVALRNWDHDALMSLLKSGLIPLHRRHGDAGEISPAPAIDDLADAVDQLENFVIDRRIRGQRWADESPWTFYGTLARGEETEVDPVTAPAGADEKHAAAMDILRRAAIAPLLPFVQILSTKQPQPLKAIVAALLDVFEACDVRGTLARWMQNAADQGDLEQQAEHAQVWNELVDLLDQMVVLLGDTPIIGSDFSAILDAGLESFDLAITPPAVDQILVGSIDRTRTPGSTRACIVMGLHEGGFPYNPRESSIFGDAERGTLRARDLALEPESKRRLLDEKFYAYVAFTRASERLILTRPTTDGAGRELAPSSYWTMICKRLFPSAEPLRISQDEANSSRCIGTPRQLVTRLLVWARTNPGLKPGASALGSNNDEVWSALYDKLARYSENDLSIKALKERAWRALSYNNTATLSSAIANKLFPDPLSASVSRLETFATCPFKHFARYGLKLESREEADVTALDLGNVYHGILENLVRDLVSRKYDFASAPEKYTESQIRHYATQIGESLRHELLLSNARNQYLLEHVERTLDRVIDAQREAGKRGTFKPWQTELSFGIHDDSSRSNLPPFELITPLRHRVKLYGKIDRVDLIEEQAAFAVIDYKLSGSKLILQNVYNGLSLQLLTYLLVLQANGASLGGRSLTPAAGFYVKLLRKLASVSHPDEATPPDEPAFHLQEKPRGIFDASYLAALDTEFTGGTSDVVHARVNQDQTIGRNSDAVEPAAFAALLDFTRAKLGELTDEIIGGAIDVKPYRIGNVTPCPSCEFHSVCRFEPGRDHYRNLESRSRENVIDIAIKRSTGRREGGAS